MTRYDFVFLILSYSTLTACTPARSPAVDSSELMNADRAFAQATAERGVDGWVQYFAEDGAMLPAGLPLTRGKKAIRDLMSPAFADANASLSWEPTEADISGCGDIGYTIGRYERTASTTEGTTATTVGKYVTIWKRQPDGSWKVVVDIGTPGW